MTNRRQNKIHDHTSANVLKIGQLNLQNSNRATSESKQTMIEKDLDYFMIQEPYSINGLVKGFGLSTSNLVLGNQGPDSRPIAAILFPSHVMNLYCFFSVRLSISQFAK